MQLGVWGHDHMLVSKMMRVITIMIPLYVCGRVMTCSVLIWNTKMMPLFPFFWYLWYTGWWYTYPSEKYESQLFTLFPIYGKKNVPNHQPVTVWLHTDRLVFRLGGNPTEARLKKKSPKKQPGIQSANDWLNKMVHGQTWLGHLPYIYIYYLLYIYISGLY